MLVEQSATIKFAVHFAILKENSKIYQLNTIPTTIKVLEN
jgi:hypothetical protein